MRHCFASLVLSTVVLGALLAGARSVPAQESLDIPILIEQKIVSVKLAPENRDGINWDLVQIFLNNQQSTTGLFPLSERAARRLDFNPMQKRVAPGHEKNSDFEIVEETRIDEFNFGPIWEDTKTPDQVNEDTAFGSLRIYRFQPFMDYLRTLGTAEVLFSRKWITANEDQSVISSQPEIQPVATGRAGQPVAPQIWEGSRLTIKPEVIENNRIAFHLISEVATTFLADPTEYPEFPVVERDGVKRAKVWRLFRLNTKGIVESGQTAVFEDFREGQGIIILTTPYILESHRKILRD